VAQSPAGEQATSNVTQRSMLGPILFNFFISDLDDEKECTLSKFTEETKLRGVADTPEGHATIQRDDDRREKWSDRNLTRFNEGKCEVLHLGRNQPRHLAVLGDTHLESSLADSDLGVLVDNKLIMS